MKDARETSLPIYRATVLCIFVIVANTYGRNWYMGLAIPLRISKRNNKIIKWILKTQGARGGRTERKRWVWRGAAVCWASCMTACYQAVCALKDSNKLELWINSIYSWIHYKATWVSQDIVPTLWVRQFSSPHITRTICGHFLMKISLFTVPFKQIGQEILL